MGNQQGLKTVVPHDICGVVHMDRVVRLHKFTRNRILPHFAQWLVSSIHVDSTMPPGPYESQLSCSRSKKTLDNLFGIGCHSGCPDRNSLEYCEECVYIFIDTWTLVYIIINSSNSKIKVTCSGQSGIIYRTDHTVDQCVIKIQNDIAIPHLFHQSIPKP